MPNIRVVLPGNTVLGVRLVRSKCIRVTIILYTLLGDCLEHYSYNAYVRVNIYKHCIH